MTSPKSQTAKFYGIVAGMTAVVCIGIAVISMAL